MRRTRKWMMVLGMVSPTLFAGCSGQFERQLTEAIINATTAFVGQITTDTLTAIFGGLGT